MSKDKQHIIDAATEHIKELLGADGSGHDWWHIYRVWTAAKRISEHYPTADRLVIELAALLHDVADWKYHNGDHEIGPRRAMEWCAQHSELTRAQIEHIGTIISKVSFKGAGACQPDLSLEGQIVQDADRLDAIGAIGIARTFAYGGHKGQLMFDPDISPVLHESSESYTSNTKVGTTINHFYEKLLLLKDRMHTTTARELAEERHQHMEAFLARFYAEWEGK